MGGALCSWRKPYKLRQGKAKRKKDSVWPYPKCKDLRSDGYRHHKQSLRDERTWDI